MTSKSIASASKTLIVLCAALAVLTAGASEARAEDKQIVLMNFKGPKAKPLRSGVLKVLKKKATLVGQDKFVRMQKKLRAKKINERNVKKVAQKLEIHGVVFGKVSRKRGRYTLNLELRSAEDGAVVAEVSLDLGKRGRLTKAKEKQLRKELVAAIDDLPNPYAEPEPEPEPEPEEEEETWEDTAREEDPIGDDRGRDRDADIEEEEEDGEPMGKAELYDALARDRAVDIAAGISVIARSLSFDVAAGIADEPNGYSGTVVPGAYVQGEIYPLAFDKKKQSSLAGVGMSFVVDKVLKISSKLEGGAIDIPTSQMRWGVGVRYRINLGKKPSGATIKLGVGYNKLAFELDQQVIADEGLDIDLPNVGYTYIDPGIAGRLPINREMALYADGRFLLVTDTGDIQGTDAYGAATVSGLDFDAGLEYRLDARLLIRGGVRFQRIGFTFDGTGALSDRNGDGDSDVSGATDQYLGGYAVAGYLF